jgi:predicted enzyme related to lactoylglutathione lyase
VYGEYHWHELATTADPVAAFAFYKELFGWDELDRYDMGAMGVYLLFGRNGKQIGGMFDKGKQGLPGGAYWVGYVRVPNMDAAVATVQAGGGKLLNGPMQVPGGDWIAQFSDPHGAFFAVFVSAADALAAHPAKPKAAKKATKKAAKKAGKKIAKKTAKKTAKKAAKKKAAKAAKRKSKKKGAKRAAKKGKKKTAKRKAKRRTVKKASKAPRRKAKRR